MKKIAIVLCLVFLVGCRQAGDVASAVFSGTRLAQIIEQSKQKEKERNLDKLAVMYAEAERNGDTELCAKIFEAYAKIESAPIPQRYSNNLQIDAYGLGIHKNQYGQPVTLRPDFGGVPGEQLHIKQNAYGLGVHIDQYGRPVREYPWP